MSSTPSRSGVHLYHCHVAPLAEHIARGMYGTFIVDPKQGRPDADEMVMVMHGFNTTFDAEGNQVYAVNGIPFHYMNEPIQVDRGELVRIYLVNVLEFDPINSFHIHANFFHYYPTGTSLEPTEFTDTVVQGQGQRGILRAALPVPGALHVPRPQDRVRRARLDGLLRGRLTGWRRGPRREPRRRRGAAHRPCRLGARRRALALIAAALVALALAGGDALPERDRPAGRGAGGRAHRARPEPRSSSPSATGPDPVEIAQVVVNDAFVPIQASATRIGRLGSTTLTIAYPVDRGRALRRLAGDLDRVAIEHEIPVASRRRRPTPTSSG